jgi:ferredoxin--NADP+ reductase
VNSPTRVKAIVTQRRDITADLWIIRVRPEAAVCFRPGQYVTVGLGVDDRVIERPYSVASTPGEPELEFFLEVVPGGRLSPNLCDVPVGDEVYVRPLAKGMFTLDESSGHRNHFMVATVTGVAPYVSMIRNEVALQAHAAHRLLLLHAASVSSELGYEDELAEYARRHDWFRYVPIVSRIWLDPTWRGERGRAEDVARKYLDALDDGVSSTTAYLCGNPHMIRKLEGILQRAGYPREFVRKELYWPAD